MVAVSSETRGQFQNNSGASSVELSRHRILCRFGACCCVILPLAFRACQSLQSCCPASCRPRWRVPSALPKNPSCPPERRRSRPPCCDIARWRLRRERHTEQQPVRCCLIGPPSSDIMIQLRGRLRVLFITRHAPVWDQISRRGQKTQHLSPRLCETGERQHRPQAEASGRRASGV